MSVVSETVNIFDSNTKLKDFWFEKLSDDFTKTHLNFGSSEIFLEQKERDSLEIEIPEKCQKLIFEKTKGSPFLIYTVLLTGLNVCLSKYTDSKEIVVGSPARAKENSALISNALPIFNKVFSRMTFKELLENIRTTLIEAYNHQSYDYEDMIDYLQAENHTETFPLFDISILLTNIHTDLPNVNHNLSFSYSITNENKIEGKVNFKTSAFTTETIKQFLEHYTNTLINALEDVNKKITDIQLIGEEERKQLEEWSGEVDEEFSQTPAHQLFQRQAQKRPELTAVVFGDKQITYQELDEWSNQFGHYLVKKGIGVEQRVGLLMERKVETLVAILGILKAGGIYLPLDPNYPPDRLSYMMEDAAPELIITEERLMERVPWTEVEVVQMEEIGEEVGKEAEGEVGIEVKAGNGAYMIYTSGSTGRPKGVVVTHSGIENLVNEQSRKFGIIEGARVLQFASLSFDASVAEIFVTLCSGGILCLVDKEKASSGLALSKALDEMNIDVATLPPAVLSVTQPQEIEKLKTIIAAGEFCASSITKSWGKEKNFLNAYGPTEATVCATIWTLENGDVPNNIPIGRPIRNMEVYILDENMELVPIGARGEIYLGGIALARGYWQRADLTAESFVPHPFSQKEGQRLYRTGDIGRYRNDGEIEYVGRKDEQVKVRGYRIELGEIESQVKGCEGIRDAVVEVKRNELGQAGQVICYVVREEGQEEVVSRLREYLRERLPEYMIPERYVEVEGIPLTGNGKVDRRALAEIEKKRRRSESEGEVREEELNPIEEIVKGIWEEILEVEVKTKHSNFFELGGHSLLATQLVSKVRDVFGVELELESIFEKPEIETLTKEIFGRINSVETNSLTSVETVEKDEPLPLSFAQQRMWFLNQFEGSSGNYNISSPLRVKGKIDIPTLEKSLNTIKNRHEILRTKFITDSKGTPVQQVLPTELTKIEFIDLTHLNPEEAEKQAREIAEKDTVFKFDFSSGKLLKTSLIKLVEDDYVLLFTMHHIVSDGWSMGIFVREFVNLYDSILKDSRIELPELKVQYADYAVWQRKWLQGDVLERQLAYWEEKLGRDSIPLELPTDFPRSKIRTFNGARHSVLLDKKLVEKLKDFSRKNKSTLFMVLIAVFKVFLYRYSQQTEISVGTPIANRNRSEIEDLIGFFVNTLVIKVDMSGDPTFKELIERTKKTTLEAYAYQDIPFEKLVEDLNPERDLSQTPLFQVMFVMQNAPQEILQLPNLEFTGLGMEQKTVKFDLTMTIDENEEFLRVSLEYNTDLFMSETIKRFLSYYTELLKNILVNPLDKISHIQLIGEEERKQLEEWSGEVDEEFSQTPAHQLFQRQVQKRPELTAVVFGDKQITYQELDEWSNQFGHYLVKKGIGVEQRVGLLMERKVETLVAILGILKAGGIYLPLDPNYPPDRLSYMMEDAAPELIITEERLMERVPWTEVEVVQMEEIGEEVGKEAEGEVGIEVKAGNGAYMIYTSGSTGRPKGVVVTHSGIENLVNEQSRKFGIIEGARVLQFASLSFDASVFDISMALFIGGTLYLTSPETLLPSQALVDYLEENKISNITITPTALSTLPQAKLPLLKTISVAGEVCNLELAKRWSENREFFNLYGPTESTIWATVNKFDSDAKNMTIGRPIRNMEVYILDENMEPVPIGARGEIYLGGIALARGYWQRADLTAESFVPHPFSQKEGQRLYRTGDIGRYRNDGEIEYVGRKDEQVKVRGYRIELGEIESALNSFEKIKDCIVEIKIDSKGDKKLVGYLVLEEKASELSNDEVIGYLQDTLPNYMVPTTYVVLDSIPLLPNGKVNRKALPAPKNNELKSIEDYLPPSTKSETQIAQIWSEVLNIEKVGINDNFFSLGGHSILLAQVHTQLMKEFDAEISLIDLFKYPTIKTLAEFLSEDNASKDFEEKGRKRAEARLEMLKKSNFRNRDRSKKK